VCIYTYNIRDREETTDARIVHVYIYIYNLFRPPKHGFRIVRTPMYVYGVYIIIIKSSRPPCAQPPTPSPLTRSQSSAVTWDAPNVTFIETLIRGGLLLCNLTTDSYYKLRVRYTYIRCTPHVVRISRSTRVMSERILSPRRRGRDNNTAM